MQPFTYLRSLQILPELAQVRDEGVPVRVGPVQGLLHLLNLVLQVLVLRLCAFQLCPQSVDLALALLNLEKRGK